jgi:hypothetical protein
MDGCTPDPDFKAMSLFRASDTFSLGTRAVFACFDEPFSPAQGKQPRAEDGHICSNNQKSAAV